MKPRTKNRSRESERLKRNQLLPLNYRYSERKKGVHVAAAIKIPRASNRTRHLWPPFCLLFRARARVKKPGYKQNNQPISQKSPLLFTSYCELIECSRPIRFFIMSLMYNNIDYHAAFDQGFRKDFFISHSQ